MRIGLLTPITHRIPPPRYGPWEQVVVNLANGLAAMGHEVTVFGPTGSETEATLVPTVPHPLEEWPHGDDRPDHRIWEELHIAETAAVVAQGGFDILHSHLSVHPLGFASLLPVPMLTTLHGAAWNRAVHPALTRYRDQPFVSISDAEREFFPSLRYVATVYNGVDCDSFTPDGRPNDRYLLFAGRLAPEKAPHLAIEVARQSDLPLKLAGRIETKHHDYFDHRIRPGLHGTMVEYLGELERREIASVYRGADALLVPLEWDEPFGLVMAESLACGTPVIGWRRGAVPELVRDGITGAVVEDVATAVAAVSRIAEIDRRTCRKDAVRRFSIPAMSEEYVAAYEQVLSRV